MTKYRLRFDLILIIALATLITTTTMLISKEISTPLDKDETAIGGIDYWHQTEFSSDRKSIYIESKKVGEKRAIYTSQKEYIHDIILSPSRELIAAIEPLDEATNSLLIINTAGEVMHSIPENVRRYDWSPDGNKIAYITGTNYEGGVGFRADGIYIFDLTTEDKQSITKDFPYPSIERYEGIGFDLKWAVHDGNLYIREFDYAGGNYLYDPSTGKTKPVSHHGIVFSPDGKSYSDYGYESSGGTYVTATDENISGRIIARFGYLPIGWIVGYPHHVRAVITEYEPHPDDTISYGGKFVAIPAVTRKVIQKTFYLYDVEKDQVVDEWIEKP